MPTQDGSSPMSSPPHNRGGRKLAPVRMIRIAITPAAYEAIIATLPQGAPLWPVQRQGGQWPQAAVVDRLAAMRGPREDYSDVILRIARLEASGS